MENQLNKTIIFIYLTKTNAMKKANFFLLPFMLLCIFSGVARGQQKKNSHG